MLTLLLALRVLTGEPRPDPFAFFQPWVTVSAADRQQLERGEPIAHTLSSKGRDVAVLAIIPVNIDGDRLVAWVRRIEELKKSRYVLAIRRFSNPPRVDDLAGLSLDDSELSDVLDCRSGSCGLKLSVAEMKELQRVAAGAGGDWKNALQSRFHQMLLERVQTYLACNQIGPYEDHEIPIWPAREFATLVDDSGFLGQGLPTFAGHLRGAPRPAYAGAESFVYWSKESVANKAIVSATDVSILRGDGATPAALVAAKQVFATHYVSASLGITALVRGAPGGPNYLVYINRTRLDMLHGLLGTIIRPFIQRRLKAEAANVLQGLRRRLESGEPRQTTGS